MQSTFRFEFARSTQSAVKLPTKKHDRRYTHGNTKPCVCDKNLYEFHLHELRIIAKRSEATKLDDGSPILS